MSLHFHGLSPRLPKEILKHADDFLQQYFTATKRYGKLLNFLEIDLKDEEN